MQQKRLKALLDEYCLEATSTGEGTFGIKVVNALATPTSRSSGEPCARGHMNDPEFSTPSARADHSSVPTGSSSACSLSSSTLFGNLIALLQDFQECKDSIKL